MKRIGEEHDTLRYYLQPCDQNVKIINIQPFDAGQLLTDPSFTGTLVAS